MDILINTNKLNLTSNHCTQANQFWNAQLKNIDKLCKFMYDKEVELNEPLFKTHEFEIPENTIRAVIKLADHSNIGLYSILATNLFGLCFKYTDIKDILICSPAFKNSQNKKFPAEILPFRFKYNSQLTFYENFEKVKSLVNKTINNYVHDENENIEDFCFINTQNDEKLLDISICLDNIHYSDVLPNNKVSINFWFKKVNNKLKNTIEYNSNLFHESSIVVLAEHFVNLLINSTSNITTSISRIEMLTVNDMEFIRNINDVKLDYPQQETIHRLFEKQVEITPDNIAIHDGDRKLDYKSLNKESNQLARELSIKKVKKGDVVCLMIERSIESVISIMAILKLGAVYLPLDKDEPIDRINKIVTDSGCSIILAVSERIKHLQFTSLQNFYKETKIQIVKTNARNPIHRFDKLPAPDRSLITLSNYRNKIGMASVTNCISLQTTRGCPYKCLYCHKIWSFAHVRRNAQDLFDEISYYHKQGVNNFAIIDDCFNLDKKESSKLLRKIVSNKLNVQLFFPNGLRGDIMTSDYIDLMREAGTRGINLSLETASPRLQKLLEKNLDLDKFLNVVKYIADTHPDIILEMATMHGFPTETEEEALMTLNFIKEIKWLHFPYIHILKIFPNTEMEDFALKNGVSKESILQSRDRAFHELPETLPFSKSFTRKYQSDFLNNYFLNEERLKQVLPVQMKTLSESALIQKYNAYLPIEVKKLQDVFDYAEIKAPTNINEPIIKDDDVPILFNREASSPKPNNAKRLLLLDLSQHFTSHNMLYNVVEQPLGLLYLLTYLKQEFGDKIQGKIYKSGVDFDSYDELKTLIKNFKPDLIGIRTLTFFKEFFHKTVSIIRNWNIDIPVLVGGPYATSDYDTLLKDRNVNLAIIGEGEYTFKELLEVMLENDFKIPDSNVLKKINGIAFCNDKNKPDNNRNILLLDNIQEEISKQESSNLSIDVLANDLAYIMYTSGSTGLPKGVMVEHVQVNNCIFWMDNEFGMDIQDVMLHRTSLKFDPSVYEMFWTLYKGAKIHVLNDDVGHDANYLIKFLSDSNKISRMYCTSSMLTTITQLLDEQDSGMKINIPLLFIGAEPVSSKVIKNFYNYFNGEIVNTYGPTEGTINNTFYRIDRNNIQDIIPIGKNVTNNHIYILSNELQHKPIGYFGEICIAGDSVTRGYMNNDVETNKYYIKNPFGEGTLYKTGDIGRRLPDGNIEINGRMDDQVKIRGYRIELDEIKKALLENKGIKDCLIVDRTSQDDTLEVRHCRNCGITTEYPDIKVDINGICNICHAFSQNKELLDNYFKNIEDLTELILHQNQGHNAKYDCVLLYNGGRGAGFALYQLIEMGFKILTISYDNGFFSKKNIEDIKYITNSLGVDNVILNHDQTEEILKESLNAHSTVCRGCFHISSSLAINYAMQENIKVVIGTTLSRGQIIENKLKYFLNNNYNNIYEVEEQIKNIQKNTIDVDRNIFDLINIDAVTSGRVYDEVKIVDFYRYCDITNERLISYLNTQDKFWKKKRNDAIYSTNCAIKGIGDYAFSKDHGFHYYGLATSWEKRLGHLNLTDLEEDLKIRTSATAYNNLLRKYKVNSIEKFIDTRKYLCAYYIRDQKKDVEDLNSSELRDHLNNKLPVYMIPSYFVELSNFPLKKNGKINFKALPAPEKEGRATSANFVAPKNALEKMLAKVWMEVLKLDEIGVHDNFFSLGADSITTIMASSKLSQKNISLSPKLISENPTIKDSVKYASDRIQNITECIETSEEFILAPIQKWFFNLGIKKTYDFNQSILITINNCNKSQLISSIEKLLKNHEQLRSKFSKNNNGLYSQSILPYSQIKLHEFKLLKSDNVNIRIEEMCQLVRKKLNYEKGQVISAGIIEGHPDGNARVSISIHHLVVDAISWRIILKNLYDSYKGYELPPKTNTFYDWVHALEEYGKNIDESYHVNYWRDIQNEINRVIFPLDFSNKKDGDRKFEEIHYYFDKSFTQALIKDCGAVYRTNINDLLLTAWALTLSEWTNNPSVVFNLEGHGRENCIDNVNVSNTVGWFTSLFPVNIKIPQYSSLGDIIKSVKEQLRVLPDNGISYGLLKYNHPSEEIRNKLNGKHPVIGFNYLGHINEITQLEGWAFSNVGLFQDNLSAFEKWPHLLENNCSIIDQKFNFAIKYSVSHFKESTINNLTKSFVEKLNKVVLHCKAQVSEQFTPSDFPLLQIDQEEVDSIYNSYPNYNIEKMYPLSPLQLGLFYHCYENPSTHLYSIQNIWKYSGEFNVNIYKNAWERVIQKHESLRTFFHWDKLKEPIQCVIKDANLNFKYSDISLLSDIEKQKEELIKENKVLFSIMGNSSLLNIDVIKQSGSEYIVLLNIHHLIIDGWSLPVVIKQVHEIYTLLLKGEKYSKPVLQFDNYIKWLKQRNNEESLSFWNNNLSNLIEPTDIPVKRSGGKLDIHKPIINQNEEVLILENCFTNQILQFTRNNKITLNTLLMYVWGYLLYKYNNNDTICFGVVTSGRVWEIEGVEEIVGLLINTAPLVMTYDDNSVVKDQLLFVHQLIQEVNEHGFIGLNNIKKQSRIMPGNPLFYSIMSSENYIGDYAGFVDLKFHHLKEDEKTNYPITLKTCHFNDKISIKIVYDEDCFSSSYIVRMLDHMNCIIQSIIQNPLVKVKDVNFLSKAEYVQIVEVWNKNFSEFPKNRTLINFFQDQVDQHPDKTAIESEGEKISYKELYNKVNHVTKLLLNKGIKANQRIGILMNRSTESVISILGTLKAGGTYVPIDPEYPDERIKYMIDDSEVVLLLTDSLTGDLNYLDSVSIIDIKGFLNTCAINNYCEEINITLSQNNDAYIIYTSGTSGNPKGVVVKHRNVINLLFNNKFPYDFNSKDVWVLFHSVCFDFSVWEIFGSLLYGGQLLIIPKDQLVDTYQFYNLLIEKKVTVLNQTPQAFYNLLSTDENRDKSELSLKYIIFGGDILHPFKLKKWIKKHRNIKMINMYGITETTVHVTFKEINEEDIDLKISNIGKAIPNYSTYVVDKNMKLMPIGITGELCVGGDGITSYINQPKLMAKKFTQNIFSCKQDIKENRNQTLYKTGDLVKWLPNGDLEYVGRNDDQIKIRGFRIELSDIECNLLRSPLIKEILVKSVDILGDKKIIAYYTSDNNDDISESLKEFLANWIPDYMIPSFFIYLDVFPLNVNGKIDYKLLPSPQLDRSNREMKIIDPRNETEKLLEDVWRNVLGIGEISITDKFSEIGGHSINALQIVNTLNNKGYSLKVSQILKEQTIEKIATYILKHENSLHNENKSIIKTQFLNRTTKNGSFPLSAMQQRFFSRKLSNNNIFNIPFVIRIERKNSIREIKNAINTIYQNHDAFKIAFKKQDKNTWVQFYTEIIKDNVICYDLDKIRKSHNDYISEVYQNECEFNLEKGNLSKMILFNNYQGKENKVLLLVFHHLIFDGYSMNIFLNELHNILANKGEMNIASNTSTTSYKDWCLNLKEYVQNNSFKESFQYWSKTLGRGSSLFPDKPSNKQPKHKEMVTVSKEILSGENEINRFSNTVIKYQTTKLNLLLTALYKTCYNLKKQSDLLLHIMSHQRESFSSHIKIHRTIGFFAGAYPVRLKIDCPDANSDNILKEIDTIISEIDTKDFDYFINKYLLPINKPEADTLYDPASMLFHFISNEVDFNNESFFQPVDIPLKVTNSGENISAYTLNITAILRNDNLKLNCYYSTNHYHTNTIKRFINSFSTNLKEFINTYRTIK